VVKNEKRLYSLFRNARWKFFWKNFQLPILDLEELAPDAQLIEPGFSDHLFLPPYHGPKDHNDIVPLLTLVKHFNPKTLLEVGTAYGATVANICAISDVKVYTINALPEQLEGTITTLSLTKDEVGCVFREKGFSDRVTQIYLNSWEMDLSQHLPDGIVDFAIIDGCHDTEFVINDFICIKPYLSQEAIVMFHDIGQSKLDPMYSHLDEGYLACMYLRKIGFNVNKLNDTWWGIWQANQPIMPMSKTNSFINYVDERLGKRSRTPCQDARLFRFYWNRFGNQVD